jgi:hypothetical protein
MNAERNLLGLRRVAATPPAGYEQTQYGALVEASRAFQTHFGRDSDLDYKENVRDSAGSFRDGQRPSDHVD